MLRDRGCQLPPKTYLLTWGILTEGEGSMQLSSLLRSATFQTETIFILFFKTTYFDEEVNRTEPSP